MTKPRYGRSSANPQGFPPDSKRCVSNVGYSIARQCTRRRGHGPDGLYCWQHAKVEKGRAITRELSEIWREMAP